MDAIEAIKRRRSVRRFLPRQLKRHVVEALVDAARLAPTADNAQPWEFVAVTRPESRERIAALSPNTAFVGNAPLCIAVFCRETDHSLEDGCAAVQNILIAATAQGLASCWIAGAGMPYAAEIGTLLKARGHHHLVALVALGHAAEDLGMRPPKRLLEDVLHWESYT